MLQDIPGNMLAVGQLPSPPDGAEIRRVNVIIRIRRDDRVKIRILIKKIDSAFRAAL